MYKVRIWEYPEGCPPCVVEELPFGEAIEAVRYLMDRGFLFTHELHDIYFNFCLPDDTPTATLSIFG